MKKTVNHIKEMMIKFNHRIFGFYTATLALNDAIYKATKATRELDKAIKLLDRDRPT